MTSLWSLLFHVSIISTNMNLLLMLFVGCVSVVHSACMNDECVYFDGSCGKSRKGVLCGECDWLGWLNDGVCVANAPNSIIMSCDTSPDLTCSHTPGHCIPSVFGVRAMECLYRGFLVRDVHMRITCQCYSSVLSGECRPFFTVLKTQAVIRNELDSTYCEPFHDPQLGCFAQQALIEYGKPYPTTPQSCCNPIIGPPPGQLVESGRPYWQECNTIGSFDPDEPLRASYFRTCSQHGQWQPNEYACACDSKWNAGVVGVNPFTSKPAYSCKTCFGFWGPKPPTLHAADEVPQLHCSVPFTPNSMGELLECGGHGVYQDARCICDQNPTDGFWNSVTIDAEFTRVLGNGEQRQEIHSVQTCSGCSPGASGVMCTIIASNTLVSQPLTTSPTPPPTCHSCHSYGKKVIVDTTFLPINITALPTPTCCSVNSTTMVGDHLLVQGGTCLNSDENLRHLGVLWCDTVRCTAYSWTWDGDDVIDMKFTNALKFNLVIAVKSGSGRACAPTSTPTKSPTRFPTAYPTT